MIELSRDRLVPFILLISCSPLLKFNIQFKFTEYNSINLILIVMILNCRYYYYYRLTSTDEISKTSEKLKCRFSFIAAPKAAALSHGKPASAGTSRDRYCALHIENKNSMHIFSRHLRN
jgi:hypothetical protein